MIRDYLKIATGSLTHRKTRSWLTLLGIFIGIAAVVALISLGQGLTESVTSEFLKLGADKLQVTPKSLGFSSTTDTKNDLRERDLRTVERTNGVLLVSGLNQGSAKVTWGRDTVAYLPVFSTSDDPQELEMVQNYYTLKLEDGRTLKQGDSNKAVIGRDLANPDKYERPLKVGDKIIVNNSRFEVVGLYKKMGDPMVDSGIFISNDAYKAAFSDRDRFSALIVQAQPGVDINQVSADVQRELRQDRGLDEGDENFEVQTPQDLVDSFNEVFSIIQFVIIGIAAISLVVGGVGIMNTMYTAVLERTKEIGIMKAIGATNRSVLTIFLLESGMLGLVGGAIGVAFGLLLAKATEYIGRTVLDTTLLYAWFSWWLVAGALVFAFTVGVLSGVLPARHASKQKPVDSLRYE